MKFGVQINYDDIQVFGFGQDCAIFDRFMPLGLKKIQLLAVSIHFFEEVPDSYI